MAQILRSIRNFLTRRAAPAPARAPSRPATTVSQAPSLASGPTEEAIALYYKLRTELFKQEYEQSIREGKRITLQEAYNRATARIPRKMKEAAGKLGPSDIEVNTHVPNSSGIAQVPYVGPPETDFYSGFYGTRVGGKSRKSRKSRKNRRRS